MTRGAGEKKDTPGIIPFSTMDEAMLHSDNARHHSNVHVEVRAPGSLDEKRLRRAVFQAIDDHPLTRARQAEHKSSERSFHWEINSEASRDPLLVVEAGPDSAANRCREQLLNMQPPLHDSPAFYVWLVRRNRGDSLIFNINHTIGDGIGALHLLRSVVNNYAGVKDRMRVDPLAVRNEPVTSAQNTGARKQQQKRQLEFMRRNMSKASSIAADGGSDRCGYGCQQLIIGPRKFKQLNPRKHVDATVNDLLLAAMHKTVATWNTDHGVQTRHVRIQTPVNVRPSDWQYEVMGNYIGNFPTNSAGGDRENAAELMATIAEQTRMAKDEGFGDIMYEAMQFQSKVPIMLKQALMPGLLTSSSTTAVVSNLGRVPASLAFGPGQAAREVWVSPPAAMPAGLGLGALGNNGSLFLAFRYTRDLFDASAAKRFSEIYLESLDWLS